ncbi:hypothetical protein BJ741DRAFT_601987 [Chytriomyces cf. hyalinus JEL632]|nr:hypothetical protein BJ741DRAFT_601987 [Chytriomyces cf. hyalinus JEL632]
MNPPSLRPCKIILRTHNTHLNNSTRKMNQLRNFLESLGDHVRVTAATHPLKHQQSQLQRASSALVPDNGTPEVSKTSSSASNRSVKANRSMSNLMRKARNSQQLAVQVYHAANANNDDATTEPSGRTSTSSVKSATDSAVSVDQFGKELLAGYAPDAHVNSDAVDVNAQRKTSLELQCDIRHRLADLKRRMSDMSECHRRLSQQLSTS